MKQQSSDQILKCVNDFLSSLPYERKPASLYEPVQYVLAIGGKRIRPVLALLGYNLWREQPEDILMPAIGLETYHNYTLLHDDLMDNADVRRGHQTVHKKWNANKAILSGDSMLVLAYQRVAQVPADKLQPVLDLFTTTALEIGEGQEYDMTFETRNDVTEDEYIEMIRLKTSVLLACALKMGAILADAPQADAERMYRLGEQIVWLSSCRMTYLMSTVTRKCLVRPLVATLPRIRRPTCSSMPSTVPMKSRVPNSHVGSMPRRSIAR